MMFLEASKVVMDGTYSCGINNLDIPGAFPYLVHNAIVIIKIVVPILLIIFGMLDLGKAVIASKEDEIKKGQQTFIKRIVAAVIVFFVFQIVQIVIGFVSGSSKSTVTRCMECFINGTVDDEKACAEISPGTGD